MTPANLGDGEFGKQAVGKAESGPHLSQAHGQAAFSGKPVDQRRAQERPASTGHADGRNDAQQQIEVP